MPRKPIPKICEQCEKPFLGIPKQKFCSLRCAYKRCPKDPRLLFWKYVHKTDGCWIWTGPRNSQGYGMLNSGKMKIFAHRFSWGIHNGPIPEGMCVLHHCDNPRCVRADRDHLFLGTRLINNSDMVLKRRHAFGSRHARAKLSEEDIPMIRKDSRPNTEIAKEYGVTKNVISDIKLRVTWRHI